MARAAWKLPYLPSSLYGDVRSTLHASPEQRRRAPVLITQARNATVTSGFLYRRFAIHTGKTFARVVLLPCHLGYKLGAVAFCKDMGIRIHLNNRVAKKKRELARALQQKKLNRNKGRGKKKGVAKKKPAKRSNG